MAGLPRVAADADHSPPLPAADDSCRLFVHVIHVKAA
jgi:hypothetical protein